MRLKVLNMKIGGRNFWRLTSLQIHLRILHWLHPCWLKWMQMIPVLQHLLDCFMTTMCMIHILQLHRHQEGKVHILINGWNLKFIDQKLQFHFYWSSTVCTMSYKTHIICSNSLIDTKWWGKILPFLRYCTCIKYTAHCYISSLKGWSINFFSSD